MILNEITSLYCKLLLNFNEEFVVVSGRKSCIHGKPRYICVFVSWLCWICPSTRKKKSMMNAKLHIEWDKLEEKFLMSIWIMHFKRNLKIIKLNQVIVTLTSSNSMMRHHTLDFNMQRNCKSTLEICRFKPKNFEVLYETLKK